jgi:undecaprenyl-diphosphatase
MTTFQSIILGVVEGLTEFLPVSSTGHMILVSHFLRIIDSVTLTTFEIVVQCGAILAVVVSYHKKLFNIETIKKLTVAFIPTGLAGVIIFPYIKHLLGNQKLVALMLLIGGIIILLVERRHAHHQKEHAKKDILDIADISYKQALSLGTFQALAIIPGVSRSGAVIVGGLLQNISRKALVEFTFLLAVPTMFVATLYTILKKHNELSLDSVSPIIIGTIVSFAVSFLVIRLALSYIRKHSFAVFGWYRIIIGIILLIVLW